MFQNGTSPFFREKATIDNVLDVKTPPQIGESLDTVKLEKLKHYNHLKGVQKYITLYEDNGFTYSYNFIIRANRMKESNYEFVSDDSLLFGYDARKKKIYGFQIAIFDSEITNKMSLEKAVILSSRYLPDSVFNKLSSATAFTYKERWTNPKLNSTIFCYVSEDGTTLSISAYDDGRWLIRGLDKEKAYHSGCKQSPNTMPWEMNFMELFNQGFKNLFVENK